MQMPPSTPMPYPVPAPQSPVPTNATSTTTPQKRKLAAIKRALASMPDNDQDDNYGR